MDAQPYSIAQAKPYSSVEPEQPPVPPHLFGFGMQSTKPCGASVGRVPVDAKTADSTLCVEENALCRQDQGSQAGPAGPVGSGAFS